jgi:hypothetical protein
MGCFVTEYQDERDSSSVDSDPGKRKIDRSPQQETRRFILMVKRFIQARAAARAAFATLEIVTRCAP